MKIGLDLAQTCTPRAGCAWYADSLARAMVASSPHDHFYLYHQFGTLINPETSAGTLIDAINATSTFTDVTPEEARRIWNSPTELVIKTGAPDLVHAMSFRAPKVPGAKLVFTVYDVSFWAMPEFATEGNRLVCQRGVLDALCNADGLIFISESSRREFDRFLPGWLEANQRPHVVTPLAPRRHGHPSIASPTQPSFWLAVGSIEPRKNYGTLLDALEIYWRKSSRRLRLRIVGGHGWNSDAIHRRIGRLVDRGLVEYFGYMPEDSLAKLYAEAEALIFPSWYEGFGLPVVEAMTWSCPVICSNTTSVPEVGGDAALYVDPADADGIAAHMLALELSPADRAMRQTASFAGAQQFTWAITAQRTRAFYEEVLAAGLNLVARNAQ